MDDVSVAAEGGDGGNLVTNGGFESPSLTKDGETGFRQRSSQRRNAAARTPHHAADWPHSLTVSVR
ncbi:MAG: hypothetical protein V9G11_01280 [Bifidobacterium adolescentis]